MMSKKMKFCLKAAALTFFDFNGLLLSLIGGLVAHLTINLELYGAMHYEKDHGKDREASKDLQRIGFFDKKNIKAINFHLNKPKKILRCSQLDNGCVDVRGTGRDGNEILLSLSYRTQ